MSGAKGVQFKVAMVAAFVLSGRPVIAQALTDVVMFAANSGGTYNDADYWTTGGPSFGLFVRKGERWLNDYRNRVNIPLTPGVHTFRFSIQPENAYNPLGLNLFFDDDRKTPGISAVTTAVKEKNDRRAFAVASGRTLRPNTESTPAANSLIYSRNDIVIELIDFQADDPQLNKPDLVERDHPVPDGRPDVSGSFTLRITRRPDNEPNPDVPGARIRYKATLLEGHKDAVITSAFSADGKYVLTCGGVNDGSARLWSAQEGRELITFRDTEPIVAAIFSPDGKRVLGSLADTTAKVWDVASRTILFTLRGHTGAISAMAFSADGKRIVTGSFDTTVRVWDAKTGRELLKLMGHTAPVTSVGFSPDSRRVISAGQDKLARIWLDSQTTIKSNKTP